MWVYQCLDIITTLLESLAIYLFGTCFCKKPRYIASINKGLIIGINFVSVYILTWFSAMGVSRVLIVFSIEVILLKICYRDSLYQCLIAMEMNAMTNVMLAESLGGFIGNWIYGDNTLVLIEGNFLFRWEMYMITLLVRMFTLLGIYRLCRGLVYQISLADFLIITLVWGVGFAITIFDVFHFLDKHIVLGSVIYIIQIVFSVLFVLLFLYVKNILYLREQEQRDKMQIVQLRQQFAYYQEKQKEEEKIRSIYHDMKNHLLVFEGNSGTDAARKMAEQLRTQIAAYEDYVHTGNVFLDIIIKDKAEKMREKHIDFSTVIDFDGVDFIEPLDISTLFGNGIDNAMEASEKLPKEQRVVLVKAGKVRSFIFILIENNCIDMGHPKQIHTTKADNFLHGFGISNMEKAAEKYGGTCTAAQNNGKFTLKILIPIS